MFLIDTRNVEEFIQGHLQYSVFVGFKGGSFEHWLPKLLPNKKAEFKLISNPIDTDEVTQKLEDMGYHNFHSMTLENSSKLVELPSISAADFVDNLDKVEQILDVREEPEVMNFHLKDSENLPLSEILNGKEPRNKGHYYTHCAGGYRSVIAISYLNRSKHNQFTNVIGGLSAIKAYVDQKRA
ncbi:metallo-beta-lactamase family protein [Vibrio ishigakensis]|uniref:Metallo-beta-lactamase family protein n=1 Tax=Vibrio ishigakensis TaxID=1481914 RepID=A0A0B8QFQ9_9VIBR|nr:metallo-beta-lactamase family protein [Vibrio ishigakensis]